MWPDEDGGWSITSAPSGYEAPGTLVPTDELNNGSTAGSQVDNWSGWFQSLTNSGLSYLIAKDAAENGLVAGRSPTGQPIYQRSNTAAVPLSSPSGMMGIAIIGALALLAVMLVKKG